MEPDPGHDDGAGNGHGRPSTVLPDEVWAPAPSLAQVTGEGRVAMIDLERPADPPIVLEGTAAAIWAALDGEHTLARVVEVVAAAYELAADEVHADVVAFVADLAARALVERRDPGPQERRDPHPQERPADDA